MEFEGEFPKTLPALFSKAFARRPERTAVITDDGSLTYGELDRRSTALANALVDLGVEPEDRVATLLSNRLEGPIVDLAIFKAGAARLPINPTLSADELAYLLADSGATTVVCDADRTGDVDGLPTDGSPTTRIAVARSSGANDAAGSTSSEGWHALKVLEDAGDAESAPDVAVRPESIAGHFYTGGTTGKPKGVLYSHACLTVNFYAHLMELGFSDADTGLVSTPLSHSGGTFLLSGLLAGGTVVVQDGFDVDRTVAAIAAHDVTWTFLVPTMLYRLLDAGVEPADVPALERVIYGAAPIQTDRLEEAIDRFGPVFVQFYGQTEVPNLITTLDRRDHELALEADDEELLRSAGRPCLLTDVRIVDLGTGEPVSAGERGEVTVRSPYAFEAYHERPEATETTLRDGWVWTGDVGRVDEDGYLYLLDRSSDVVVTGGLNVYTREVEEVLGDHPAVAEVAVIGVPHEEWGEAVHAVVVADEEADVDAAILREYAGERLAGYKKPKAVEFVDALPETPLGKPDKDALRDRHWDDDRRIG